MSFFNGIFYYVPVTVLFTVCAYQYGTGQIASACFFLIGAGILLILNEVKRNARIINNYQDCHFISHLPELTPHSGPAAPGSPEAGQDDGTER